MVLGKMLQDLLSLCHTRPVCGLVVNEVRGRTMRFFKFKFQRRQETLGDFFPSSLALIDRVTLYLR